MVKGVFNIKALTLFDHPLLFSRAILLFRSHFLKSITRWYVLRGDCFGAIFKRLVNGQIFDLEYKLWDVATKKVAPIFKSSSVIIKRVTLTVNGTSSIASYIEAHSKT